MDINILLALQDFRNGTGAFLAAFLSKMTWLGELNTAIVIMALLYWCVSKDFGTYFLMGWSGNRLVNGMLKVTVCAYRPWIRDARILPYGDSITTATGYSFPSGHTMNAATVYGGGAVRRDIPRVLRVVLGLLVLLVAFSRNYLGVHTPQDVLVGAVAGTLVMCLTIKLMQWIKIHPEKDLLVVCIGVGLAVLVAIYAAVKPYPTDTDAAGRVLVEGAKMANDTFKGVSWSIAFLTGWILERRFVQFTTNISMMKRITRLTFGLLSYYVVSLIFVPA
ncbi:MAG: phosphatase PAP2 family protein, partial [Lachnospiraceae bacterium]|nr:phosphatase PAP2 family protein [Lachnospiraceae bacterium]